MNGCRCIIGYPSWCLISDADAYAVRTSFFDPPGARSGNRKEDFPSSHRISFTFLVPIGLPRQIYKSSSTVKGFVFYFPRSREFDIRCLAIGHFVLFPGALAGIGFAQLLGRNMMETEEKKAPSLLKLCIQTAIDNIRYMGDVGETDIHLLKEILPHCTADQLMNIENSSKGRDLSSVTDSLWMKFYEQHFGEDSLNLVLKRMKQQKIVFKWKQLYEAKLKERDVAQQKSVELLRKKYAEEGAKKQSRQIQLCSKIPPSSKRSFWGGSGSGGSGSSKGNLMKKARTEFLNSHEVKVHQTMKRQAFQTRPLPSSSISRPIKPTGSQPASGLFRPPVRR